MAKHGDSIQHRVKAIVVCPNGVSIAKLMETSLTELFPEFVFMDSLSVREFLTYNLEYDIVFSPIYLQTDKKLFVVQHLIHQKEKERLRRQVINSVYGYTLPDIDIDELIKIINKYSNINNIKDLKREMNVYLKRELPVDNKLIHVEKPKLIELLYPEHIMVASEVNSWKDAIELASQPLLNDETITKEYVAKMIKLHDVDSPYVIYGSDLAIPHAMPEDGVNKIGMSLLKINNGIRLSQNQCVKLVVILAPIDKNTHLRALLELSELSELEEKIEEIVAASSPIDVYEVLKSIG